MPAHRKPTHRHRVVAAASLVALTVSGVAFGVQRQQEPVRSAPEPLTVSSAPAAPPSSAPATAAEELDARSQRPSRATPSRRTALPDRGADKAREKPSPTRTATPSKAPVPTPVEIAPAPTPRTATAGTGIVGRTNAARADAGLPDLSPSSCLATMAQRHAERQARANSLFHQDLDRVLKSCGTSTAGENVAMNYTGPARMVGQWMESSGHRANILNRRFSLVGVGLARARDGAWYGVQVFGAK